MNRIYVDNVIECFNMIRTPHLNTLPSASCTPVALGATLVAGSNWDEDDGVDAPEAVDSSVRIRLTLALYMMCPPSSATPMIMRGRGTA